MSSRGAKGSKAGIVVFDGGSGDLSLSVGDCAFVYEEPHEAQPIGGGLAVPGQTTEGDSTLGY